MFGRKYTKNILGYLLAPVIIGIIILLMSYPKGFLSIDIITYVIIYSYSLGIPFMIVAYFINWYLDKNIGWLKNPLKRFILNALLEVGWALILILIVHYFFLYKIRGAEGV